nr:hypothetical protein Iba_chr01aCG2930 [Ipomoea batatas]
MIPLPEGLWEVADASLRWSIGALETRWFRASTISLGQPIAELRLMSADACPEDWRVLNQTLFLAALPKVSKGVIGKRGSSTVMPCVSDFTVGLLSGQACYYDHSSLNKVGEDVSRGERQSPFYVKSFQRNSWALSHTIGHAKSPKKSARMFARYRARKEKAERYHVTIPELECRQPGRDSLGQGPNGGWDSDARSTLRDLICLIVSKSPLEALRTKVVPSPLPMIFANALRTVTYKLGCERKGLIL